MERGTEKRSGAATMMGKDGGTQGGTLQEGKGEMELVSQEGAGDPEEA